MKEVSKEELAFEKFDDEYKKKKIGAVRKQYTDFFQKNHDIYLRSTYTESNNKKEFNKSLSVFGGRTNENVFSKTSTKTNFSIENVT